MRNYLTFDNKDSRDFGVYINGQGTFRAPARSYNVLNIPGRNGDLLGFGSKLDNVEITYRAFIYTNFDANIAALRSFLLSHVGYFKLTDSYHPDEYRLAYYKGPFVPDVVANNGAGSFDLTFVCKPQRFLNSGEEVTTLTPAGAEQHTYQGEIVNFSTLAGDKITSALADFHPIQDLHGYSHPWPAGGGINKLNMSAGTVGSAAYYNKSAGTTLVGNGSAATITGTNPVEITNTSNYRGGLFFSDVLENGKTYALRLRITGENTANIKRTIYLVDSDNVVVSNLAHSSSVGQSVDYVYVSYITPTADNLRAVFAVESSTPQTITIYDMGLNDPDTDTAFYPYSNICPISGLTGLSVYDDPKYGGTIKFNQKFPTKTLSYVGTNYTITSNNDGKFTVNATATASQSTNVNHTSIGANAFTAGHVYAWIGNSDKIKVDLKAYAKYTDTIFKATTASYNNIVFLFDNLTAGTYEVFPQLFDLTEMFGQEKAEEVLSAEQSSTGSGVAWFRNLFYKDYYPYNAGETTCVSAVNCDPYWKKTVDWTSQAGTVYGGTVDPVAGQLTVDWAMVDMGTLTWDYITNDGTPYYFRASADGRAAGSFNVISSIFKTSSAAGTRSLPDCGIVGSASASYVYIRWDAYTDAATFKAAMSGVQLCYELATPLTYQLTPQEIEALADNYMWSDVGQVTVTVTDAMTIENPTLFDAKPLLRVYGAGTLTLGGQTITISTADVYTDIDCELMDCFKDTVSKNGNVSFSGYDFPVIPPGRNVITMDGVTQVDITPRWWAA